MSADGKFWIKGNTHSHTTRSDGNRSPAEVAELYRSYGYDFLCISDHNTFTDPAELAGIETGSFILIPSEELSNRATGPNPEAPVHVCAMGCGKRLEPVVGLRVLDVLAASVRRVADHGATPIVAHPNFGYAFDHRVMRRVDSFKHFEIWNSSSACYNQGNAGRIPCEQMWDILLSEGRELYAVASDDAHDYSGYKEQDKDYPGGGWVGVRVSRLTADDVISALKAGDFYASTGVELEDVSFDGKTLRVAAKPEPDLDYFVRFIGLHGQFLAETDGHEAAYTLTGSPSEAYVRAKVIASNDDVAWTQPVRPARDNGVSTRNTES